MPDEAPPATHRVPTSGDLEVSTYLEIAREKGGDAPSDEAVPEIPTPPDAVVVIDFGSQY
jgi:GMP synthase (glutamine-hydrolysing)